MASCMCMPYICKDIVSKLFGLQQNEQQKCAYTVGDKKFIIAIHCAIACSIDIAQ